MAEKTAKAEEKVQRSDHELYGDLEEPVLIDPAKYFQDFDKVNVAFEEKTEEPVEVYEDEDILGDNTDKDATKK